jgi:hypothetical protein
MIKLDYELYFKLAKSYTMMKNVYTRRVKKSIKILKLATMSAAGNNDR